MHSGSGKRQDNETIDYSMMASTKCCCGSSHDTQEKQNTQWVLLKIESASKAAVT